MHGGMNNSLHPSIASGAPSRSRTPNPVAPQSQHHPDSDHVLENDSRTRIFNALYTRSEARLDALFSGKIVDDTGDADAEAESLGATDIAESNKKATKQPPKKTNRAIDEDEYDNSEEDEETPSNASPLKARSTGSTAIPRLSSPSKLPGFPPSPALTSTNGNNTQWQGKGAEDARQKLEDDKKNAEEAAKRSFNTMYWPLDNDRVTMLEQQRLEESERQVDVEMAGQGTSNSQAPTSGTLSSTNLGASSLVLKHLIARIDAKREKVKASDQELRNLMVEVKKNRSKWANEDKVGQEELYEAAEKVLIDIKSNTEHSQPFLQKVNKKDAPDYYHIIKEPMDLGAMTKKLRQLAYKSKAEFVKDLNLIWSNCMRYNDKPGHFLLKHAEAMKKMSERLIPLIPEIKIRDRAEVEAEERRQQNADGDAEGADDSDDEPIISSRGRKATSSKKAKKGSTARKSAPEAGDGTPGAEGQPQINGTGPSIRHGFLRADSDTGLDGSRTEFSTPPPGTLTPAGQNGIAASSQADPMELDNFGDTEHGHGIGQAQIDFDDPEFKIWKQVTKKDRAAVTAERHRLFKGDKLNPEEPALIRSRGAMRRWLRRQRDSDDSAVLGKRKRVELDEAEVEQGNETLAEGLEDTEERILPDYYDIMAAVPEVEKALQWKEDQYGYVLPGCEETLRVVPEGFFTSPSGTLANKMKSNLRQMQDTRKIVAKIGIVKQMQLQSQMYQNQFQKYDPEPLFDKDVDSHIVSDDGPVMSQYTCRAAMQRSIAKIFYNAGFEEYQPCAIDAVTDMATDYLVKLGRSLGEYVSQPKVASVESVPSTTETKVTWKRKLSLEESILQTLNESGIDLEALDTYAKDDSERLGNKLTTMHERMKAHLAELLRPAMGADAGSDGVHAFNDGSEQFLSGDFAEDTGDDFLGFRELGLDKEFGLAGVSVPLHLLQSRMHSVYRAQNTSTISSVAIAFPPLPLLEPVTTESVSQEIGLIQRFFKEKLSANNNQPVTEDEDLPQKQRLPKPRLPPTGKITSPRKRPAREAGPGKGHPKKKMRLIEGQGWVKQSELEEKNKEKGKEKEKSSPGLVNGEAGQRKDGPSQSPSRRPSQPSSSQQQQQPPGSKLKHSTSAMDLDGASGDSNGDMDEDMANGVALPNGSAKGKEVAGNDVSKGKGKTTVNGTNTEGGMISPESLEAP